MKVAENGKGQIEGKQAITETQLLWNHITTSMCLLPGRNIQPLDLSLSKIYLGFKTLILGHYLLDNKLICYAIKIGLCKCTRF